VGDVRHGVHPTVHQARRRTTNPARRLPARRLPDERHHTAHVYLPFIVLVAQRYQKKAGLGTIAALMIPYSVIVLITWTIFFVVWFLLGIPMGPGYPAQL
jgi:AbgT putative transporter family